MSSKRYTHDELKNECFALEAELLKRVFQDDYRENMRLIDLIRHLEDIAASRGLDGNETFGELMRNLRELRFLIASGINGDKGERRARRALEWLPIDHKTIYGLQLEYDGYVDEYDAIVLTVDGVFIIEVKYSACNTVIDARGNLCSKTRTHHKAYNLGERMQSKEFTLWKTLQAAGVELDRNRIHGVLLYANDDSEIDDLFGRVKVCRCGDINYYISDFSGADRVIDHDAIGAIKSALEHSGTQMLFKPSVDFGVIRERFECVMALIDESMEACPMDEAIELPADDRIHTANETELEEGLRRSNSFSWRDVASIVGAFGGGMAAMLGLAALCKQH